MQDTRGCSIYEHTAVRVFILDWQLAPAEHLSDLATVDADLCRLNMLTDSRLTSPETQTQIWNWLWQRTLSTLVVHCLPTAHCWLRLMHQRWQNMHPPDCPKDLSKILRTPSNILHTPSNILCTPSNILHNPQNIMLLQVVTMRGVSTPQFITPGGKDHANLVSTASQVRFT